MKNIVRHSLLSLSLFLLTLATASADSINTAEIVQASQEGFLTLVQELVEKHHINVNTRDENGFTPLLAAAKQGQILIVQYLLEKGAHVNARDNNGMTALMWAIWNGHTDIAQLLMNHKTNVSMIPARV